MSLLVIRPLQGRVGVPARILAASLLALSVFLVVPAAQAQGTNVQSLINRIDRLQRDLNTLQQHIYRGETPPPSDLTAPGGGGVPETQAARIEVRLSQFESELRTLTGQLEEQSFRIKNISERLDRLVADVDQRLLVLEGGTPDVAGTAGEPVGSEGEPQMLGTVSKSQVAALSEGGAAGATSSGTPRKHYDHAFKLLSQTDYEGAERAFNSFLGQFPQDPLAGNAKYWLGETYYVRKQYDKAAVAFAEGYQSYPDSAKAPDNLLKLGKSLAALEHTSDACGTFAELLKRYGDAKPAIRQRAKSERKRLNCK